MTQPAPFFSIIIVSLNGASVIERVLDSTRQLDYPRYETIVVDNGSTDGMGAIVSAKYPEVRLVQSPINLGFAGGNNLGLREAHGDICILLNDDTEMLPECLTAWAKAAADYPDAGILGAKLLYGDRKTIQHAGAILQPDGNTAHRGYEETDEGQWDEVADCDYVTGAALAIRREVMDKIGLLDVKYWPIYFEELDYCWRAKEAGFRILYIPDAVVIHYEGRTQGKGNFRFLYRYTRCKLRFMLKCWPRPMLRRAARLELRNWRHPFGRNAYLPWLCAYLYTLPRLPLILRDRRRYRKGR